MKYVLNRDFTAVNKVATDGGAALHCALAASSCEESLSLNEGGNNQVGDGLAVEASGDDDNDDDDDDDDDDSVYSDSDDEDVGIDKEYLQQTEEMAENDSAVQEYCSEYDSLSSEEITLAAIYLLLDNGADPNIPLGNVHGIRSLDRSEDDHDDDDDEGEGEDEMELTFARENIIQQWTPLMFVMQWIILACVKCIDGTRMGGFGDDGDVSKRLALPIAVLKLLLDFDADRSYMMAGEVTSDWNALQVLASASHILGKMQIDKRNVLRIVKSMRLRCVAALSITDDSSNLVQNETEDEDQKMESMYDCIQSLIKTNDIELTPIQSFAVAAMMNNAASAQLIIENECHVNSLDKTKIQREWSSSLFETTFPTLQTVWGNASLAEKTIFDMVCSCFAMDSLKIIMGGEHYLSEGQIRSAVISVFEDLGSRSFSEKIVDADIGNRQLTSNQMATISIVLQEGLRGGGIEEDVADLRQRVLDRLLVESCTGKMWTIYSPHATLVLLQLGADPNISSIVSEIHDALTPLHLIAGNCRGTDGIVKMQWLLYENVSRKFERANVFAMTKSSHEIPINVALRKKNFSVAGKLLDAMGEKWTKMQWSLEDAILIGQASIDNASVSLFKQAIGVIVSSASTGQSKTLDTRSVEKALGGLLILAIDERSGFGKVKPLSSAVANMLDVINIIGEVQEELNLTKLASWTRDEISGQNLLHSVLRGDRGSEFRKKLLRPVCELTMTSEVGGKIISQACATKFGGYSPLHLACALGCEESISTLMEFDADINAIDAQGKKPIDLITATAATNLSQDLLGNLESAPCES